MNKDIKPYSDRIYAIDKAKFRRLVVWIAAAERTYRPEIIVATLKAFEPLAREVSNEWWPYLDRILDKVEARDNARTSEAEHNARKEAEAEYARSTFGGREIRKDTRQNR